MGKKKKKGLQNKDSCGKTYVLGVFRGFVWGFWFFFFSFSVCKSEVKFHSSALFKTSQTQVYV